jgi:class 3 adenylate cyclase
MKSMFSIGTRSQGALLSLLVVVLLLALPIAVWADLRDLSEASLRRQASDLSAAINSIRRYYADHIVARVQASTGPSKALADYEAVPGAIPIPATLSIELGQVISEQQRNFFYRFVSDYPFKNRAAHALDRFETSALQALRSHADQQLAEVSGSLLSDRVRHITPVIMEGACVACHNTHPDSPKRDWKIGDVRGIQEVTVAEPIAANILSFKYLLAYLVCAAASGLAFIAMQWRQAAVIAGFNRELKSANEFLASVSRKISRYLSPQVYNSIFTGQTEAVVHTERKKLTIFFSDIKDFTATTERMQPEDVAQILNEYLTEMSAISLTHGGTLDKFIGDAILIFFGDPETRGTAEDAKACIRMATDMQRRLGELNAKWRKSGIEHPFRVRMGINTGFCNVGNFGSSDRMEYTIIGAEANLAARLQSIAEPGQIAISYETYALVRDIVTAHPLAPISMKGISRQIVPYAIDATSDASGREMLAFSKHARGLDFFLDPGAIDTADVAEIRDMLRRAAASLDRRLSSPQ